MLIIKTAASWLIGVILLSAFASCAKKDIQFGTDLGETYTRLIELDSVGIQMSTYVLDSFATNAADAFLSGAYQDSILGDLKAGPYFQLTPPEAVNLTSSAVYDSLSFVLKPNGYAYGDTSAAVSIAINELSNPIDYTYGSQLFNTSAVAEKPTPLGTKVVRISPARDDSILVRLSDVKGRELFTMLKEKATAFNSSSEFLNYFYGVSLQLSPSAAVYGFNINDSSLLMRLHYHTSIPFPQEHFVDFHVLQGGKFFNQIVTDRSRTPLAGVLNKGQETPASSTNNRAFMQSSAGVLLKLTFPSLRNILQINPTLKLIKATLVLKAAERSYDNYHFRLPSSIFLRETNGSNTIGDQVMDATGEAVLYGQPVVDRIYGTPPYYSFDVTGYINTLLTTSGRSDYGFFLMESTPGQAQQINRLVLDNTKGTASSSKLILSLLTIKN